MSDRIAVMEAGRVHQVGTPQDIYHRPTTAFVARFIGSSNVLTADVVEGSDRRRTIRIGDRSTSSVNIELDLPDHVDSREINSTMTVVIRPENVRLAYATSDDTLPATVTGVEFTGMTTNVETDFFGEKVGISLVNGEVPPTVGERVGLRFGAEYLRVVNS